MADDRRRKADRKSKRIVIRFGVDGPVNMGYTKDVSATGLRLEARKIFPAGTLLRMTVGDLPDVLWGRVKWAHAVHTSMLASGRLPTMGIHFEAAPASPP